MRQVVIATTLQAILLIAGTALSRAGELLPVPDRLIVLTFDDGIVINHSFGHPDYNYVSGRSAAPSPGEAIHLIHLIHRLATYSPPA